MRIFPVASVLVSKEYRKNIYPIYVFARLADDIADEYENQEEKTFQKLELLESYLTERSAYSTIHYFGLYMIQSINSNYP